VTAEKTPEGLVEVGRFCRPHGVKGQIYIKLSTDRSERVQVGARLWAGEWFEVSARTSMVNTGADRWVVGIVGIDDRNDVERLVNKVVWAEPIDDPDAVWVHQVIGARVVGTDGVDRGTCIAVLKNPANDLLELESGALVPVLFVESVVPDDADGFVITIDPPEGLFEVFEDTK
jgi:16S rRNA processing protein RimM